MNDRRPQGRLLWLTLVGGLIVLALVAVPFVLPGGDGERVEPGPSVVPEAAGVTANVDEEAAATGYEGFSLDAGEIFSIAWRLGLVIVVIALSVAGLRWWGKRTAGPQSVTGFLRVVDTLPIGNGRSIHLVALGSRVITVGATAQQISFLESLTPEEAADVLARAPLPRHGATLGGFTDELLRALRRDRGEYRPRREAVIGGGDA
ncbi:MAG: hypothetical protein Kow0010_21200 [Dehalococcoidia bacterium]